MGLLTVLTKLLYRLQYIISLETGMKKNNKFENDPHSRRKRTRLIAMKKVIWITYGAHLYISIYIQVSQSVHKCHILRMPVELHIERYIDCTYFCTQVEGLCLSHPHRFIHSSIYILLVAKAEPLPRCP